MHNIDIDLKNHICKTCDNLTYYDWYFCKLGKHKTKHEFLNMRPLKKCEAYKKRYGSNWNTCIDQECIFWCNDCPAYKNENKIKLENNKRGRQNAVEQKRI